MTDVICSAQDNPVKDHDRDTCVPCLQMQLASWKKVAREDVVEQLRIANLRLVNQRKELARMNERINASLDHAMARGKDLGYRQALRDVEPVAGSVEAVQAVADAYHEATWPKC